MIIIMTIIHDDDELKSLPIVVVPLRERSCPAKNCSYFKIIHSIVDLQLRLYLAQIQPIWLHFFSSILKASRLLRTSEILKFCPFVRNVDHCLNHELFCFCHLKTFHGFCLKQPAALKSSSLWSW